MVINEQRRRKLHQRVEQSMGTEAADMLLDELPPVAWAEIATKQDLANLTQGLANVETALRAELRAEISDLRGDFSELRGEMKAQIHAQTRHLAFGMLGMWIATLGAVSALFTATGH